MVTVFLSPQYKVLYLLLYLLTFSLASFYALLMRIRKNTHAYNRITNSGEQLLDFPFRRQLNYIYHDKKSRLYIRAAGTRFE